MERERRTVLAERVTAYQFNDNEKCGLLYYFLAPWTEEQTMSIYFEKAIFFVLC
jgi:hypothetical protein